MRDNLRAATLAIALEDVAFADDMPATLSHEFRRGYRDALLWAAHAIRDDDCEESQCQRFRANLERLAAPIGEAKP